MQTFLKRIEGLGEGIGAGRLDGCDGVDRTFQQFGLLDAECREEKAQSRPFRRRPEDHVVPIATLDGFPTALEQGLTSRTKTLSDPECMKIFTGDEQTQPE